jgi:hypothetical protein
LIVFQQLVAFDQSDFPLMLVSDFLIRIRLQPALDQID